MTIKENNALGYQIRDYAANMLKSAGFKGDAQLTASAIAGNYSVESWGFQDRFITGDKVGDQGSEGLAQWRGPRLIQLKEWSKANGMNHKDWRTQIAFTVHELKTTERTAWNRMEKAKTINQAVDGMLAFERPQGYKSKDATGSHQYEARLKKSMEFSNKNSSEITQAQGMTKAKPSDVSISNFINKNNPSPAKSEVADNSASGNLPFKAFSDKQANLNENDNAIFNTFGVQNIQIPNLLELFSRG
jgi:hypothetical protein